MYQNSSKWGIVFLYIVYYFEVDCFVDIDFYRTWCPVKLILKMPRKLLQKKIMEFCQFNILLILISAHKMFLFVSQRFHFLWLKNKNTEK